MVVPGLGALPGSRQLSRQPALSSGQTQCYNITTMDPLSTTAGALPRLALAAAVLACVWLAVFWAIA